MKAELELTKQLKDWEKKKVVQQQQLQTNVNLVDSDIDNHYLPKTLQDVGASIKGDTNVHTFRQRHPRTLSADSEGDEPISIIFTTSTPLQ